MKKAKEDTLTKTDAVRMCQRTLRGFNSNKLYASYRELAEKRKAAEAELLKSQAGAKVRRLLAAESQAHSKSYALDKRIKEQASALLDSFRIDGVTPKNRAALRRLRKQIVGD